MSFLSDDYKYILKNADPQKRAELRLCVNAGSLQENDNQQNQQMRKTVRSF